MRKALCAFAALLLSLALCGGVAVADSAPYSLSIRGSYSVEVDEWAHLDIAASPALSAGLYYSRAWSSDPCVAIAGVEGIRDGVSVLGVSPGTATITVRTEEGVEASCSVTVTPSSSAPTSISLQSEEKIAVGSSVDMRITLSPQNAKSTYSATTSDSSVAYCVTTGGMTGIRVYGAGEGRATITVATSNGLSADCLVTVVQEGNRTESIRVADQVMRVGEELRPEVERTPANSNCRFTIRSSNYEVVRCTTTGGGAGICLQAVKPGTANVTVATNWGSECTFRVEVACDSHVLEHQLRVEPTCTVPGKVEHWKCGRCEKHYADSAGQREIASDSVTVKATGHEWGEWVVTREATCTVVGSKMRECARCKEAREELTIPALGHKAVFVDETATAKPGEKCQVCSTVLSGCKPKTSQPSSAQIKTSKLTAKGARQGKLTSTKSFSLKKTGVKDGAGVSWSRRGSAGGAKIKVTKSGRLYAYKGLKAGAYRVRVIMSIAPTSNYKAKSVAKTIEVIVK